MTAGVLGPLLVGPAVVVDDKIDILDSDVQAVLRQIEDAKIPLMRLRELPDLEEVRHWAGFSMIVLDWELHDEDEAIEDLLADDAPPSGVMLPDTLTQQNDEEVADFIRTILDQLYRPIFIVSNLGADEVKRRLGQQLGDDPRLAARVLVRGKGDVQSGLWDDLDGWLRLHPAVYALKAWEAGYEAAKHQLFSDLEVMSANWPGILWATFGLDSVNEHFELAETLNRNILHRMGSLVFDSDAITNLKDEAFDRTSLHRVLHGQAVVPASQIPSNMMMQGDFYFTPTGDGSPPDEMLINLSAACDLVARDGSTLEDTLVRVVTAQLKSAPTSKTKLNALKSSDGTTAVIHLLTPFGVPYEVKFSSHREMRFGDIPHLRQGRLLPPYLTQLFQAFALYLLRPGLPRLPDAFYLEPPPVQSTGA